DAVLRRLVEAAMPDEMQDVILALSELPLQLAEGRALEADEIDAARKLGRVERGGKPLPFGLDIERRKVRGVGDDGEDVEGGLDAKAADHLRQVEIADERRVAGQNQEARAALLVEELPREIMQLRRVGDAQAQAQPGIPPVGFIDAAVPAGVDLLAEDGLEK